MPGKKRKGSKKGGPGSEAYRNAQNLANANVGSTGIRSLLGTRQHGQSPGFTLNTNKRQSVKKHTGVKKIKQRTKKKS